MANTVSLVARLKADAVDPAEFQSLLLDFYSRGTHIEDRKIGYGREEKVAALIVDFNKAGRIASISKGPAFVDDEVDAIAALIQSDLIDGATFSIGRKILFARLPLEGCYRYQERFQLLPVPPEAPKPQFASGAHPFQIEVAFRDTAAISARMGRVSKAIH